MNYILFGDQVREHLLPFTFLRPVADIRVGMLTIREKWEHLLQAKTSSLTVDYLSEKFPMVKDDDNVLINSSVFPSALLVKEISSLTANQTLVCGDVLIAHRLRADDINNLDADIIESVTPLETSERIVRLTSLFDIISMNRSELIKDHHMITAGRKGQPIPGHVGVIEPGQVFIEEGARLEMCTINATNGPVYIGRDAVIMDGAHLRGPLSIGQSSVVRMGAKIYENTSVGPESKVGGEVADSVIFGYSNKSHDGFLGHSVIGEWCNLAAGTNTSNLRLDYGDIRLWDYSEQSFVSTGSQFCGVIMGDHSKTGINTMLNTGTLLGVSAQVYGTGFMRNYVPSFMRGSMSGYAMVDIEKAIETAKKVFKRRNREFDQVEEAILRQVFQQTLSFRKL